MTGKNLAVEERESEREPMLRGGKKGKYWQGKQERRRKSCLYQQRRNVIFCFPCCQPTTPFPLWFASYRAIFSDIFKRKVASFLRLNFSMSFIRNGVYIYNQFGPPLPDVALTPIRVWKGWVKSSAELNVCWRPPITVVVPQSFRVREYVDSYKEQLCEEDHVT